MRKLYHAKDNCVLSCSDWRYTVDLLYAVLDVAGFYGRNINRSRLFHTMAKNLIFFLEVGYVEDLLCESAAVAAWHT